MKRTLCVLLSLMLAVTGFSWLLVPASAADNGSPFIAEDFEGTYSIGRWAFDSNGGMLKWEGTPGDYDLVTGHYCNGNGSSRGGNESAEIVKIGSGNPVRFGMQSLKLNYDFRNINGIEGACVGFTAEKEIPGNPTGVGLWYYNPEGGRNFWLRLRVLDGTGAVRTLDLTTQREGVNWFGWKYVECGLTSYQGPFRIPEGETIRVMHTYGAYDGMGNYLSGSVSPTGPDGNSVFLGQNTCSGAVYLDNLQFVYGEYTPEPVPEYSVGDTVRFGSYPQSRVMDDATLDALEATGKTWKSYGYYVGTGTEDDGLMTPSDFMQYCDVTINGTKYRGVTFSHFRPYSTGTEAPPAYDSTQNKNGYLPDTVYWFRWEPLQWRVLNPDKGLLLCESAIDAQAYQNLLWRSGSKYYQGINSTVYANDYATSSVRKWLNSDFFQAAFTPEQKCLIVGTTLDNRADGTQHPVYDSAETTDRVFLLSSREAADAAYGFNTVPDADDDARTTTCTDYAKCQGLSVENDTPKIHWMLRSAGYNSVTVCAADHYGGIGNFYDTSSTTLGIRPAITVNLGNLGTSYKTGDLIEYGSYPKSRVTNQATIGALNAAGGTWQSYGYYNGTGTRNDGQMTAKDYMQYCDVTVDGRKYRGVKFSQYRPYYTGFESSEVMTYQNYNDYDEPGVTYWFRYDPLCWRVLDPAAGLVLSETVIDSQPFNNYALAADTDEYAYIATWGDADKAHYANNYAESSLRQWLNDDFRETAFTAQEESRIVPTTLDNSAFVTAYSAYDSVPTTDKVFLLTWNDAANPAYGFMTNDWENDPARQTDSTDYAKCQGLTASQTDYANWLLRSAGCQSEYACAVDVNGSGALTDNYETYNTGAGIRPAITLDLYLLNVPPHVHAYDEPVWDWAHDHSSATATFTCAGCGDEQTAADDGIDVNVVTAENCTNNRVVTYTASVTFDGTDYTDTTDGVTVPDTATGHNWEFLEWDWRIDPNITYSDAVRPDIYYTVKCSACQEEKSISAPIYTTPSSAAHVRKKSRFRMIKIFRSLRLSHPPVPRTAGRSIMLR